MLHGHEYSKRSEIKRQKNDVDNEPVKEGKNREKARTNLDERAWNQKTKILSSHYHCKNKNTKIKIKNPNSNNKLYTITKISKTALTSKSKQTVSLHNKNTINQPHKNLCFSLHRYQRQQTHFFVQTHTKLS